MTTRDEGGEAPAAGPGWPGRPLPPGVGAAPGAPPFPGGHPSMAVPGGHGSISGPEARSRTYGPSARSPLWLAVATVVSLVLCYVVPFVVLALAVDASGDLSDASDGAGVALVTFLLLYLVTAVLAVAWLTTIGTNRGSYGVWSVLNLVFPIWLVAFALFGEVGLALGYVLYFCWPVRMVMVGLCAAAKIPQLVSFPIWCGGLASAVLAPVGQLLLRDDPANDAASLLLVAGAVLGIAYAVFWLVALAMATIIQHLDITADRRVGAVT